MSAALQADGLGSLNPRNFQRLARFIEEYSGIKMPPSKLTMLEGRLRRRVRATRLANLAAYCDYLFDGDGLAEESVHLIDAVTTNKTEFFREPEHFRILAEHVETLPGAPLKIWSAACSIGAEPYTLAMVLADLAQRMAGLRFAITGTDICTEALETAAAGIYPEAMVRPVPAELRRRYVARGKDRARGLVRVVPELRGQIRFARLNLMDAGYPLERDMDVVFCRNILIYFDKPTQQAVLRRLCDHLRPGGLLFVGHSETLAGFRLPVAPVAPTVFRKQ